MVKEPRGAVVSVRISEDEQARLRRLAEAQGKSVSELVRSVVVREVDGTRRSSSTVTMAPLSRSTAIGEGVFWTPISNGTVISPGTLTIRADATVERDRDGTGRGPA
jgi:hypothetical protein